MRTTACKRAMKVSVETGSRLHMGFTNLSEDVGRSYGSIGVTLDRPRTTVVLERSNTLDIAGENTDRIWAYVRRFSEYFSVQPDVTVDVRDRIPEHAGLGSGTQLALALGMALATMSGVRADVHEVARAMGRGRRSGVGVAAFDVGGSIIDACQKENGATSGSIPTIVFRRNFPSEWRFVVAIPGSRGVSAVRVKRRRSGCSRRPREFQKKYAGLLSSGSCRLSWRKISRNSVTLSLPLIGRPALTLQMYRAESMGEERRVS